ncbi:MAG: hypothetical protein H7144_16700 [Burkholderiales bacterium]|nr:hypothetical protein [Phycisphaerae bacterium]
MTSRSSIFSFDTLKIPREIPKATLFALALVGLSELGVRAMMASGKLEEDVSLRKTLVRRIDTITQEKPPIWFLGNSTLDWGVDENLLSELLGRKVIKLAHGSATVNASAAMLDFYISQTGQKPERVVVTLTKDDINRNGFRAERSQTYLDLARDDKLPFAEPIMLRRARANIRDGAVDSLMALKGKPPQATKVIKAYDGRPLTEKSTLEISLLKDFDLATDWFAELKSACARNGLPAPVVVLMPTTDQYGAFHDQFVGESKPTYEQVHAQIVSAIEKNGLICVDFSVPARGQSEYAKFRDPYHLRPEGEKWFTRQLAGKLTPLLPATQPSN